MRPTAYRRERHFKSKRPPRIGQGAQTRKKSHASKKSPREGDKHRSIPCGQRRADENTISSENSHRVQARSSSKKKGGVSILINEKYERVCLHRQIVAHRAADCGQNVICDCDLLICASKIEVFHSYSFNMKSKR